MTSTTQTTRGPAAAAIALNRFGLGVRPDEPLPADPKRWLLAQFERYEPQPRAWAGLPDGASIAVAYADGLRALRTADAAGELALRERLRAEGTARYRAAVEARVTSALTTPAPFAERLVHFWANHFAVSADKPPLGAMAGAFELEAIRPHVFGRFDAMLLAVERHPAMLLYLDQVRSIGPGSAQARRAARAGLRRGLNENLAREVLELHTVGVRTGYGQDDVGELARALTGWTIGGLGGAYGPAGNGPAGGYAFQPALHEPGVRTVLGKGYPDAGEAQAEAMLRDLAALPATARHLAAKLARHFVGDAPPPGLVDRLAEAYLGSGGDLPAVYRALVDAPESWAATAPKFKTPWDWTLSALRGLDRVDAGGQQVAAMLAQLGQPMWRPGSPAGWDDVAASWLAPDALMRRVELAQRLGERAGPSVDARALAPRLLPGGVGAATAKAIARAESPAMAVALLLASPEFMRR